MSRSTLSLLLAAWGTLLLMNGCRSSDDGRIPSMPVSIDLTGVGIWNTWGVTGVGMHREFIIYEGLREPSGFHYVYGSTTGFGGVLLISGMDPFSLDVGVPLAYDLACPVEREPTVRVAVDPVSLEAVCPQCHSHYDVVMAGGAPTQGPAFEGKHKYSLRRYQCLPGITGGYTITD